MPVRIECPKCAASLALPDSVKGKSVKVTCKKCGAAFSAKVAGGAPADGTKPAKKSEAIQEGKKPKSSPARRPAEDDGFDFDNGDDRRSSRPRAKKGGGKWLLIGGALGVLLLAGGGVGLYFVFSGPNQEQKVADAKKKDELPPKDKGVDVDPAKVDPTKTTNPPEKQPPEKMPPEKQPPEKQPPEKMPPDKNPEFPTIEPKDPAPAKEPIIVKLEGGVRHLTLSPDGKLVAVAWQQGAENGLNVYQWPTMELKQQWKVEVGGRRGLSFAADNKTLYAVDKSFFAGVINAFDVETGKELGQQFGVKGGVQAQVVVAAPDNSLIFGGNRIEIKAWSPATKLDGKVFAPTGGAKLEEPADAIVTSDGKLMFVARYIQGKGEVRLWEPISGAETTVVKDIPGNVGQLAITRDGSKFLFVYQNPQDGGGVRCCDREGKELWFWKPPINLSVMWTISLSPDEKHVAVGGNSSAIRILDMADGKVLGGFKGDFQTRLVAFQKDGKLITSDLVLRIWDLADMRDVEPKKDPPIVVKKDPPPMKEPPAKPAETIEHKGAIVRQFGFPVSTLDVGGKPLRFERLQETVLVDAMGVIPNTSARGRLLEIPGNVVDVKVRLENGRQMLTEVTLVKVNSDVPPQPGNFELKGAKVKQFGGNRVLLTDATGKDHMAVVHGLSICYEKTGALAEGANNARIFKANNVVDVWLYPEPNNRTLIHMNVGRLVSGELMTDAELKAPAPEVATLEKLSGKLRVGNVGGMKSYSLHITVVLPKGKKGFTHRNLVIDGEPKAFDMKGNAVPWAMIFHESNTLEVVMETRNVMSTVKEARLVSGVVK